MAAEPKEFYLHLVSDATGTTLQGLARAALAQFDDIAPNERFWPLVRTKRQLERVMDHIAETPGPVLFTLVDQELRLALQDRCEKIGVPSMAVLDPVIKGMSSYLGLPSKGIPGLQYALDDAYFARMDAMDFALSFDDGKNLDGIENAEVVLVGVSRTSKTPTCVYLARRGIRAANVPFCPGVPFPDYVPKLEKPLFVGLTESPDRLISLRRTRLKEEGHAHPGHSDNDYIDLEKVEEEVKIARRFYSKHGWPVIDVTRRSVEETAAEIMLLLQRKKEKAQKDAAGKSDE